VWKNFALFSLDYTQGTKNRTDTGFSTKYARAS